MRLLNRVRDNSEILVQTGLARWKFSIPLSIDWWSCESIHSAELPDLTNKFREVTINLLCFYFTIEYTTTS